MPNRPAPYKDPHTIDDVRIVYDSNPPSAPANYDELLLFTYRRYLRRASEPTTPTATLSRTLNLPQFTKTLDVVRATQHWR